MCDKIASTYFHFSLTSQFDVIIISVLITLISEFRLLGYSRYRPKSKVQNTNKGQRVSVYTSRVMGLSLSLSLGPDHKKISEQNLDKWYLYMYKNFRKVWCNKTQPKKSYKGPKLSFLHFCWWFRYKVTLYVLEYNISSQVVVHL